MLLRVRVRKRERDRKCEKYVRKVLSEAYEKLAKREIVNE